MMCGILAKSNFNSFVSIDKFTKACELISHRGPDQTGHKYLKNVSLGHKRLSVIDLENGVQPMSYDGYHLVYNGELYNTPELRDLLSNHGYTFTTSSDTEVLLKMYHCFKEKCLDYLNGIFAFVITNNEYIFAARDRMGVKPLFYHVHDQDIFIASELKCITSYFDIKTISKNGLLELLALGPSHTPGYTPFDNIFELREGHYLKYDQKLTITCYWNVVEQENNKSFDVIKNDVKMLLEDAIKRQLVSDVPLATFLSGGIDSSIITAIAALEKPYLDTYSVDFENSRDEFLANNFQKTNDQDFINYVTKMYSTNHHNIVIAIDELVKALDIATILRDSPGMADIDSSLYLFAKQVKEKNTVCLSGECADEIFGGYPWFNDEDVTGFPWIRNIDERISLLNNNIKKLDVKAYLNTRFEEICKEAKTNDKHKLMMYINLKYFMQTLLERKDRMTMGASLEVRVPFADHRLVEYLYNVPMAIKNYKGIEKGLLREAMKDYLPHEVYTRRKSPYPKTYSKTYTKAVTTKLETALMDKTSILHLIFDEQKLKELILHEGSNVKMPWFGQLMAGPQLIAYLYQIHVWGKKFEIYQIVL